MIRTVALNVLASLHLHVVLAVITTSNNDTLAAAIGTVLQLECRTDSSSPIRWNFYNKSDYLMRIHNGDSLHPTLTGRYEVHYNQATGESTLLISNVNADDSGAYVCLEYHTGVNRHSFVVTVLDSPGETTTSGTPDEQLTTKNLVLDDGRPSVLLTVGSSDDSNASRMLVQQTVESTAHDNSMDRMFNMTHIALGLFALLGLTLIIIAVLVVSVMCRRQLTSVREGITREDECKNTLKDSRHQLVAVANRQESLVSATSPRQLYPTVPNENIPDHLHLVTDYAVAYASVQPRYQSENNNADNEVSQGLYSDLNNTEADTAPIDVNSIHVIAVPSPYEPLNRATMTSARSNNDQGGTINEEDVYDDVK